MTTPEIRPVVGSARGQRSLGFFFDWHHDWDSFTPRCNWRDFTFLKLAGEWNHQTERVEIEAALLGLHARLTYVWGDSFARELMDRRDDFLSRYTDDESEIVH